MMAREPDMHDDELTPSERTQFDRLPRAVEPPGWLEGRVIARMKREHLVHTSRSGWLHRWLPALATGVIALLAGVGIGRATQPPALPLPTHALLLYEGPGFEPYTADNYQQRYGEYSQWIAQLSATGSFSGGELFTSAERVLEPGARGTIVTDRPAQEGAGMLGSFLMIHARDLAEAERIARSSPHSRYGGRIAIREITPTDRVVPVDQWRSP